MEIDDYDISYSSICDRINGDPQAAKKELLRLCNLTVKAEEKVAKLEEELSKAKTEVRFFKRGIYNTFDYFHNRISKLPSSVTLREGKTIYIIKYFDEDNITINVEKESF
ncbi:hypothetical protein [Capnocytophaga leadbetteri]|uniref:hypothetical protein n=1 Tax=Capnocytophaga leadbetteri TaxID=327575 RepID=UPI0028E3905D|nr:hypothetical protein [Capnocytophaga leadbetteri]